MYETMTRALENVEPLRDGAERCRTCGYYRRCLDLDRAAANAIRALQAALARAEAERDAAMKDVQRCCETCANAKMNSGTGKLCEWFDDCNQVDGDHWEWRGAQREG